MEREKEAGQDKEKDRGTFDLPLEKEIKKARKIEREGVRKRKKMNKIIGGMERNKEGYKKRKREIGR